MRKLDKIFSIFIGIVIFFSIYNDIKSSNFVRDAELKMCNAEINGVVSRIFRSGKGLYLVVENGDSFLILLECGVDYNDECFMAQETFIERVKIGDKIIKEAKANTFISIGDAGKKTWAITR